ncbi:MAG TPA: septum site-determining protein MinC [Firmicutes bacterium]|nr:septum site-determining protein MinC [Bacillota bacterium]
MQKYAVEFKGTREGLTIYCLEDAAFEDVLADLAERLQARSAFFGEAAVKVDIGRRELTEEEKDALIEVITKHSRLQITEIQSAGEHPPAVTSARRQGEMEELKLEGFQEGRCLVIKRTLRSGQYIRFPGTVVVLGDVNPGAEIVADGDIFVFGTLRGIAHAGVGGDRNASVVALRLAPTQLRIADVISRAPDNPSLPDTPEYAYINDARIMIAAITSRQNA